MKTVAFIFIPILLLGGWLIDEEEIIKTPDTSVAFENKIYFDEEHVRVSGDRGTFIVDLKDSLIYLVNENEKIYTSLPLREWLSIVSQIESSMGQDTGGKVEIERTSLREKIAGYTATKYIVYVDGKPFEELWISPEFSLPELQKLEDLMERISPSETKLLRGRIREELQKIQKGWPLKTVTKSENESYTTVIKNIKKLELKGDMFRPPESYKEIAPDEFFRGFER